MHITQAAGLQCLAGTEQAEIIELSNAASQGTRPDSKTDHKLGSQAVFSADEPTVEDIRKMDSKTLFQWIQKKLYVPLNEEDEIKFLDARIDGQAFLNSNLDFFQKANLPHRRCHSLAELARLVAADEPTTKKISEMDQNTLFQWIQRKLDVPLNEENATTFLNAQIDGGTFLEAAGDV